MAMAHDPRTDGLCMAWALQIIAAVQAKCSHACCHFMRCKLNCKQFLQFFRIRRNSTNILSWSMCLGMSHGACACAISQTFVLDRRMCSLAKGTKSSGFPPLAQKASRLSSLAKPFSLPLDFVLLLSYAFCPKIQGA